MNAYLALSGVSLPVFVGITLVLGGGCAFMTGRALALNWRPQWHYAVYALMLAAADRFLIFALFDGALLSVAAYLADACLLIVIATFAFRLTRARQLVRQYPWDYEMLFFIFSRPCRTKQ
ncbi:MAG: hypothetical protein V4441_02960 [Pseudomonadota bacterium]